MLCLLWCYVTFVVWWLLCNAFCIMPYLWRFLLDTCCDMLTIRWLLWDACYANCVMLMIAGCCLLNDACCVMPDLVYILRATVLFMYVACGIFVLWCSVWNACCLTFVVWCLLCDAFCGTIAEWGLLWYAWFWMLAV